MRGVRPLPIPMTMHPPIFVTGFETVLGSEAARAAIASAAETDPALQAGKVLSAILLSVAAIEAAVGVWSALFGPSYGVDDSVVKRWRGIGPTDVMKDILTRVSPLVPISDVPWFTSYCAIVALRNHVAHYFPEYRTPGDWPDGLKGYVTGKLLVPGGDSTMDWTSRLLIPSVAHQVVDHGRTILRGFVALTWKAA